MIKRTTNPDRSKLGKENFQQVQNQVDEHGYVYDWLCKSIQKTSLYKHQISILVTFISEDYCHSNITASGADNPHQDFWLPPAFCKKGHNRGR
jgi:hypothetical protein